MAFNLPVQSLPKLREEGFIVKSFSVGYQYMMWYNTKSPQLSDVRVRRAIDMALDRHKLTQAVRGGTPTRSLFPHNTPHGLKEQAPHADLHGAERLLDQAGWVKTIEGIREKHGVALSVRLVAYPQRPDLVTMQPVIAEDLKTLGMQVTQTVTSASTWDELDGIIESKDFEMLLWAQHTLPAGDAQFFMNMFFRSGNKDNHAQLESPQIDALIDALSHAEAGDRVPATAAAHEAILEQVPVSFLMTPSWHVGLGNRLMNYEPWGSDYYMIRADFGLPSATSDESPVPSGTKAETVDTSSAGRAGMTFVAGTAWAFALWF